MTPVSSYNTAARERQQWWFLLIKIKHFFFLFFFVPTDKCIMLPWPDLPFQKEHNSKKKKIERSNQSHLVGVKVKKQSRRTSFWFSKKHIGSPSYGNSLQECMHLLASKRVSLTKNTCFHPLCPWGFYTGLETQQTELLFVSYTTHLLTLVPFFIPSVWAPFIFSHMLHHSFPTFSLFVYHLSPYPCFIFCPSFCYSFLIFNCVFLSHPSDLLHCLSPLWLSQLKSLSPAELLILWY